MEINKIHNIDCREGLRQIADGTISLVVTDPAYKVTSRGGCGNMSGYWTEERTKQGDIFEVNDIDIEEYLGELYRVLEPNSHCYIMCNNLNLPHFLECITRSQFHFVKCLIWDKRKRICGRYYMNCFEYIIFMRKGADKPINECGTPDLLSIPTDKAKSKGEYINPTAKPVELFEVLIRNSTNEGDIVLDPFMGSGTTAVACKMSNRRFIGFEIDPKQTEQANARINTYTRQGNLF